jgi:hypothetical protein
LADSNAIPVFGGFLSALGIALGAAVDEKDKLRGAALGGFIGLLTGGAYGYILSTQTPWKIQVKPTAEGGWEIAKRQE